MLVFLLMPAVALGQTRANVVAACGTPNSTYSVKQNAPMTQDTTGKLCGGGIGAIANVVATCGMPNRTYSVGQNAPITQDTTGKLCQG